MAQPIHGASAAEPLPPRPKIAPGVGSRIPALDGLRGIAILAVFMFHYARGASIHASSAFGSIASALFALGWTGVDLFFVLSGFLITGILYDTEGTTGYYRNFYARRILRIFPVYYLFAGLLAILAPFLGVHWHLGHLFFLFYLGYPAAIFWPSLTLVAPLAITHLWSLAAEEQFYMIWPWAIARLRNSDAIMRTCAVVGAAALVLRIVIRALPEIDPTWAYAFLPARMDALAIGAALAILVRGKLHARIDRWAIPALASAVALLMTICISRRTEAAEDPLIGTVGCTLIAIACGALLLLSLREGSWLQRLLSFSPLRACGKYSYGLYLYHLPLSVALHPMKSFFVAGVHSAALGGLFYVASSLSVNLIVAMASYRLVEAPIMRLKSHFSYKSGHSVPPVVGAGLESVCT